MKNLKKMSVALLLATTVVGQTLSNPAAIRTVAAVLAPAMGAGATAYGATQLKGVAVQATAPVAEAAVEAVAETVVPAIVEVATEAVTPSNMYYNGSTMSFVKPKLSLMEQAKALASSAWKKLVYSEKVQNVVNAEATQKAVAWASDNKEALAAGAVVAVVAVVSAAVAFKKLAKAGAQIQESKTPTEQETQNGDFAPGFDASETPELKVVR